MPSPIPKNRGIRSLTNDGKIDEEGKWIGKSINIL